jgi:hypothetical protein
MKQLIFIAKHALHNICILCVSFMIEFNETKFVTLKLLSNNTD